MVVGLDVDAAALAALDHQAVGVVVVHVRQQLGLAASAAVGLAAAALAQRLAGGVPKDLAPFGLCGIDQDHVELRHALSFQDCPAERKSNGSRVSVGIGFRLASAPAMPERALSGADSVGGLSG